MNAYTRTLANYANFQGRTARAEFWRAHVVLLPLLLIGFGLFGVPTSPRSVWPTLFFILIIVPHAVPWAALVVRRLHDMDQTGWWALIGLLPLVMVLPVGVTALLIWACRAGSSGSNRFGDAPTGPTAARRVAGDAEGTQRSPDAPDAIVGELERLAQLKAAGHLTESEFALMKAKALGGGSQP